MLATTALLVALGAALAAVEVRYRRRCRLAALAERARRPRPEPLTSAVRFEPVAERRPTAA